MNKTFTLAATAILLAMTGCTMLDEYLTQPLYMGDGSGSSATIGEASADTVDSMSETIQPYVHTVASALTGNPILGGAAAAMAAGLLALASDRLRRKKKQGGGDSSAT